MEPWTLISGVSGGVGSSISNLARSAGFKVIGLDLVEPPVVVDEWLPVDLANAGDDEVEYIRTATSSLNLPYVVGTVGGTLASELGSTRMEDVSMSVIRETVDLNLLSAFPLLLGALPAMRRSDAPDRSLTFVSSINALGGYGAIAYSSAKAGLSGLVSASSPQLASEGIRINAIALGTTHTANLESVSRNAGRSTDFALLGSRLPRGRVLSPSEAAKDTWVLATKLAAVTGQVLVSDGAQSLA